MKRALFTVLAAVACGSMTVSAVDATSVKVTLQTKGGATKIEKLGPPSGSMAFGEAKMSAQPVVGWQLVNIPVKVEGKVKGDKSAQFASSIKFTAHLLIDSDSNGGKPVKLSKEITYVDIPLSGGGDTAKNEMYVGVFIPPSSAVRINEKGKGDLKGKLLGVAMEAEFNGKQCMMNGEPRHVIYDNNIKKKLTDEWWTKSMGDGGAVLYSIDQTPYAAFAGNAYPQIAPTGATGMPTTTPVSTIPSTADEEPAATEPPTDAETTPTEADTDTAEAEDEEESDDRKSKKSKKKKSSKRTRR